MSKNFNRRGDFFRPLVERLEDRSLLASLLMIGDEFVPMSNIPGIDGFSPGFTSAQMANGTIVVGGVKNDLPAVLRWHPTSGGSVEIFDLPEEQGLELGFINSTSLLENGTVRFWGSARGDTQRAVYFDEAGNITVLAPSGSNISVGSGMSPNGTSAVGYDGSQPIVFQLSSGGVFSLSSDGSDGANLINDAGVAVGSAIWKPANYSVKLHGELPGELDAPGGYSGVTGRYVSGGYFSFTDFTSHAALWDLETLEMLHDFGPNTSINIGALAEDEGVAFICVVNTLTGAETLWGYSSEEGLFTPEFQGLSNYSFAGSRLFVDSGSVELFGFGERISDGVEGFFYLKAEVAPDIVLPPPPVIIAGTPGTDIVRIVSTAAGMQVDIQSGRVRTSQFIDSGTLSILTLGGIDVVEIRGTPAANINLELVDLGDGNDRLISLHYTGSMRVLGGNGNDLIYTGNGDSVVFGGAGMDIILGGNGSNYIDGGAGNDYLIGGNGSDVILGGEGHDRIFGRDGNDWLFGEDGNDHLDGGRGDDILSGGKGTRNMLYGGQGHDTFYVAGNWDIITDPNWHSAYLDTNPSKPKLRLLRGIVPAETSVVDSVFAELGQKGLRTPLWQ